MKLSSAVLISAAVALLVSAGSTEPDFENMFASWLADHNKLYVDATEHSYRLAVFTQNYYLAQEMSENDDGAVYDVTGPFADMTPEEFASTYLSPIDLPSNNEATWKPSTIVDDDDAFDWKDEGVITPVRSQGSCGSCWAFSACGALEGVWAIAGNDLVDFSPQQLVDCDTEVDMGCKGGLMDEAYKWIADNGGIVVESDYPYKGKDNQCQGNPGDLLAALSGHEMLGEDEDEMAAGLMERGPLAVAINASWLQFYRKGISNPKICSPQNINHGVTMTGFGIGEKKGKDMAFWNIKNSWGDRWGEDGYFRLARGSGKCGINTYVVSPTLAEEASLN